VTLPSSPRYGAKIIWIALHTAEGARTVGSLYGYFDRNQNASSHAGADGYQLSEPWVPDERAAWTLLNGNPRSLNLEMCGFAHWTREQWLSTGWVDGVWNPRQMIRHAAAWTRQKCDAHSVPRRLLTPAEVGQGMSGIIDHARYTFGTGDGNHTDVGKNFPWDVYFSDLGGGSGEEDPLAGITIQQIENAAYAAVTNALQQASTGVNGPAYWAFNKILGDHAVGPIRGTLAQLADDEAKIIEAVRTTANSPIDIDTLAEQLAVKLGPELGGELLTKMAERLAA
jgi:hypothetical protein